LGAAEDRRHVSDYALDGKPTQDWLSVYKEAFARMRAAEAAQVGDYSTPPKASPAAQNSAYLGTYQNDFFGEIAVI
jgi:hypothetical protein